jgi:hypothetical protein
LLPKRVKKLLDQFLSGKRPFDAIFVFGCHFVFCCHIAFFNSYEISENETVGRMKKCFIVDLLDFF